MIEQRVLTAETKLKEFEFEFKAINKILAEISNTLTEIKVLNSSVMETRQELSLIKHKYDCLDTQSKKLFEYHDSVIASLSQLKSEHQTNTAKNDVKIGYGERIIWGAIAAVIAGWQVINAK